MKLGKVVIVCVVAILFSLSSACSKSQDAMPLTKQNLLAYKKKLMESQTVITPQDQSDARASQEGAAKLFRKTFVRPVEELGYDYDKTIRSLAQQVVDGKTPQGDPELIALTRGFVMMAKATEPFATKNGFITAETGQVLAKIQAMPNPMAVAPAR